MNIQVFIDWKFVLALGGAVAAIIVSTKLDHTAAESVSIHTIDSAKEYIASYSEAN